MKKKVIPTLGDITYCVRLPNGLAAYIIPKKASPVVSIQAYVRTGSIHEEEFLGCGLSHFLEHMLFMGSSRYPGNAASDKVTFLGGYFNACTSKEYTSYITFLPSKYVAEGLDILDDMLRNPLFPADKFESEKNVILRESAMYDDSPESRLDDLFAESLFSIHPARFPIIGYQEKIRSVTRDMMCAYYQKRYSPHRCFYVIVGDVDVFEVEKIFTEKCSSWAMGDLREPYIPAEKSIGAFSMKNHPFADPQTRLAAGWHIPDANMPDYTAARGFFNLLVQSDNSRLDKRLVMEKELAFDVYGSVDGNTGFANASIFATCPYGKKDLLIQELYSVTESFAANGPTEKELDGALTRMRAAHCRTFLTAENIAAVAGGAILCTGGVESVDAYAGRFEELTPERIMEAGRKYFCKENSALVALLPKEKYAARKVFAGTKENKKVKNTLFHTENGYKTIFMEDKESAFINLSLVLPCGSYCGKGKSAAGHLLADLLPTGTAKYTEEDICNLLSENAISLDLRAGNSALKLTLVSLREKWDTAINILHSILHEPLYDKKKLERERLSLVEEYKSNLVNPEFLSFETFSGEMVSFPHAAMPEEHLKSMQLLTAEDLKDVFENVCLNPEKAVLGLAGNLTVKEAERYAEKLLGTLKKPLRPLAALPVKKYKKEVRNITLELDKNQAVFLTGFPGCAAWDKDRYALEILKEASCSMSSKLFDVVRNQNGLAYYTGVKLASYASAGSLIYYAGTEKASLEKLAGLFEEEIARVRDKGLSRQEVEEAVKWISFREAVRRQNPGTLIGVMAQEELFGGTYNDALNKTSIIEKLTHKEINSTIRKYLSSPTRLTLIAAPPGTEKAKGKKGAGRKK